MDYSVDVVRQKKEVELKEKGRKKRTNEGITA
jgi:hypothetical protein